MSEPVTVEIAPMLPPSREALVDEIRAAGFEPEIRGQLEQRDAGRVAEAVLLIYLTASNAVVQSDQVAAAVLSWFGRLRRRNVRARHLAVIYGPNGEVMRRVEIPEPDED